MTLRITVRRCVAIVALTLLCAGSARAGGGNVQPPEAKPAGYSLADMAQLLAYFDSSGNDPAFLPQTPFQVLHTSDTNAFTVAPGTRFFVPVLSIDDSPPVLGDFPGDAADAGDYVFDQDELGGQFQIVVDGRATDLGPDYVAGPVLAPGLKDGGGSHLIQIGAFLTPLTKGKHTVTIRGLLDGDAIIDVFGGPYLFEDTYTVTVR